MSSLRLVVLTCLLALWSAASFAQESPYFVTYTHYLEEPGNLEIGLLNTTGVPKHGNAVYHAPWLELEYGVTGWWTAELYVEGITTTRDGGGFTGWRSEHRFRPLRGEHRVNPLLYVEYEDLNEASRIQKEIVGSGGLEFEPIASLRRHHVRELEAKLVLSSAVGGWNASENVTFEKNLSEAEGVEFGYSVGVSRPLGALARGANCRLCRENFVAGVELYGGLGSTLGFGAGDQRHYVAPALAWGLTDKSLLKVSVGTGLTEASDRFLVRLGWTYELPLRGRQ